MGTGYTRNDVSNNIAAGNVINASDLDGEFDAIVDAFHAATGHTHDGTAAEGAPITVIGPVQDYVGGASNFAPKTNNAYDLGSASLQWKDLYVDGIAYLDQADITTLNVSGAGTFTTISASGDVAFDTSGFFFDQSTGAVGVGTNSPAVELHIASSLPQLRLQDTDGTNQYGDIQQSAGDLFIQVRNDATDGRIIFRGVGGGVATEYARFDASGNLGIGTNTPGGQVHIESSAPIIRMTDTDVTGYSQIRLQGAGHIVDVDPTNVDASSYYQVRLDGSSSLTIAPGQLTFDDRIVIEGTAPELHFDDTAAAADEGLWQITSGVGDIVWRTRTDANGTGQDVWRAVRGTGTAVNEQRWYTSNSQRMTLDSSGALLIDKTSSDLTTAGAELREGQLRLLSTSPSLYFVETDGTSTHNITSIFQATDQWKTQTRNSAGTFIADDFVINKGASGATDYIFHISGSEQMRIDSTGVGIGTATPSVELDVVGNAEISETAKIGAGALLMSNLGPTPPRAVIAWSDPGQSFQYSANTELIVARQAQVNVTLATNAGGNCFLNFADDALEGAGGVTYAHASDQLGLKAAGVTYVTLSAGELKVNDRVNIQGTNPELLLDDTGAAANEGVWRIANDPDQLFFQTRTDANGAGQNFLVVNRTGTTVTQQDFFINNVRKVRLNSSGMSLNSGSATVDTIETTLTNDDTNLPTSGAVYGALLGVGQTWQDVSGSRTAGTSYQNTTGKPIMVHIRISSATGRSAQVSTDNATWIEVGRLIQNGQDISTASFVVPDDHYYRISASATVAVWSELR